MHVYISSIIANDIVDGHDVIVTFEKENLSRNII